MLKAGALSMKMDFPQTLAALAPAVVAAPAYASDVMQLQVNFPC